MSSAEFAFHQNRRKRLIWTDEQISVQIKKDFHQPDNPRHKQISHAGNRGIIPATRDMVSSLINYLSFQGALDLNQDLRTGAINDLDPDVLGLDALINRQSFINSPTTVFRGIGSGRSLSALRAGDVAEDKGYSSTSFSKDMAEEFMFSNTDTNDKGIIEVGLLNIEIPTGTKGLAIDKFLSENSELVEEVAGLPAEEFAFGDEEFLLPRGSKFLIDATNTIRGKTSGIPTDETIIKATLLP